MLKSHKYPSFSSISELMQIKAIDDVTLFKKLLDLFLGVEYGLLDERLDHINNSDEKKLEITVQEENNINLPLSYDDIKKRISTELQKLSINNDFAYSLNKLDCITFVETILAIMLSFLIKYKPIFTATTQIQADVIQNEFEKQLIKLRYKKSQPTFLQRNHFLSIDWLENNKNILNCITDTFNLPTQIAQCEINKLSWLLWHPKLKLKQIEKDSNEVRAIKTQDFCSINDINNYNNVISNLKYLSLNTVLDNYSDFVRQMPEIALVCIVRPNWEIKDKIGTNINISHLGIAVKDSGKLVFYHATSENSKQVVKIELQNYLQTVCLKIKSIKGINISSFKFL